MAAATASTSPISCPPRLLRRMGADEIHAHQSQRHAAQGSRVTRSRHKTYAMSMTQIGCVVTSTVELATLVSRSEKNHTT